MLTVKNNPPLNKQCTFMQCFLSHLISKNFAKVLYSTCESSSEEMKRTVSSFASSGKLGQNVIYWN